MRIGCQQFDSPLTLAPLAGYTNLPFRLLVRELGGVDWAVTDLIHARSLLERHPRALQLARSAPAEKLLAVQLFGSVPEEMRDAAAVVESLGRAAVDINMGCPVRKVVGIGGGAAMMTELRRTQALVRGMVAAVKIPVTAKMRLGWDEANLTAPDLARALADVGVAAIFVHGRTRAQGFSGRVNLAGIRAVVAAVPGVPVFGNGDVTTPEAARHLLAETGCAGVSIGRGAFYDPWIFRHTLAALRGGAGPAAPAPAASHTERLAVMRRHLDLAVEHFGEEQGCKMFRKPAVWYARRLGPAKEFRRAVVGLRTRAEFEELVARYERWRAPFCDAQGELLPQYRPVPLTASFLQAPGAAEAPAPGEALPVPRGPVDTW